MDIFKTMTNATKSSVKAFFDRIRRQGSLIYRFPLWLAQQTRVAVKKVFDFALGKPASASDYVKVNRTMLSKNFLVKAVLLIGLLAFVMIRFVYPYLEGWLWTASVIVNSEKFHSFSGKADVKLPDGTTIYRGTMENGSITGIGEVYDKDGNLLYVGNLVAEKYEGEGSLYENGVLLYTGQFSNNLYNGSGRLYYPDGTRHFTGFFVDGKFEGEGTLFYPNGKEAYIGRFVQGKFEGMGRQYYENGRIQFDGFFADGLYQGAGKQYFESGVLQYDGYFERGLRTGAGKLYKEDDGTLLYDGNFLQDLYDGYGRLMGEQGRLLYEGGFRAGLYEGEGRLMTASGTLLYEGGFARGLYQGYGKLLYAETDGGRTCYEGAFQEGLYHGIGTLYNRSGVLLFSGDFYLGEINYLNFINAARSEIEAAFGRGQLLLFDDSFLFLQQGLEVGFLFYFSDGITEPLGHRILLLGNQRMLQCVNGMLLSDLRAIYTETYTEYYFTVEALEEAMLHYLQHPVQSGDLLYCAKMIENDAFIRVFATDPAGTVLYYEIGGV